MTFTGTGPDPDRQECAHIHQVFHVKEHDEVLLPDLGGDRVHRLKKSADGAWTVTGAIKYPGGVGPRHLAYRSECLHLIIPNVWF